MTPAQELTAKAQRRVGFRVRLMRENAGLSVRAVARLTGLPMADLYCIEAGVSNPTVGALASVAAALGADDVNVFFI